MHELATCAPSATIAGEGDIREILRQEQEHQNDFAGALRTDVPDAAR